MHTIDIAWGKFVEKGDDSSFSMIYNHHVDILYSYGVSLGFLSEMCKDAIQDTFVKLYLSREDLIPIENITAFLFKSFKNRLIDLSRRQSKEEVFEVAREDFLVQVSVLDNMIDRENEELLKQKVTSLLSNLTPNQREVVYLRYMIGLKHKEIADVLEIREESARKLLYRTLEKLRDHVTVAVCFALQQSLHLLSHFPC